MNWMSTFFLGVFGSTEDVGIYRIAERTSILLSFFLVAVNSMAGTKFAALYKREDLKAFASVVQGSAKLAAIIAAPMFLLLLLAPEFIMGIYGEEFTRGSGALIILAIGQYINVAVGPVGLALIMSGNEKSMRDAVFIGAVVNIGLNMVLTPIFGIYGAAITASTGIAVMNILCMVMVWNRLGIWALPIGKTLVSRSSKPKTPDTFNS